MSTFAEKKFWAGRFSSHIYQFIPVDKLNERDETIVFREGHHFPHHDLGEVYDLLHHIFLCGGLEIVTVFADKGKPILY
jgi:hypothetical protein